MQLNWKLRIKNKSTLAALIALLVGFCYKALGILGITPSISENTIIEMAWMALDLLVAVGIIVDPTTHGPGDTAQAMSYTEPRIESEVEDDEDGDEDVI